MITESQQKTIEQVKEAFEKINDLIIPPSDLMAEIEAELNRATALKLKSETALSIEQAKAKEVITKYADEVYRPILNKYLPDTTMEVSNSGSIHLAGPSYQTFSVSSLILERKNDDKSKYYELVGFRHKTARGYTEPTEDLSEFDEEFKKFVIDSKKSIDKIYY